MRQKSRACYTSCDRPARRFRLDDSFTAHACQLGTNLADHFEAQRFNFQHLRNIFAEMLQLATAVRASFLLREIGSHFPWQVRWQRPPRWPRRLLGVRACFRESSDLLRIVLLQCLEPQLQLLDLPIELLRGTSKFQATQLGD